MGETHGHGGRTPVACSGKIAVEIEKYMRDHTTPPNEKDLARLIGKTSDRVVVVPREELVRNLGLGIGATVDHHAG